MNVDQLIKKFITGKEDNTNFDLAGLGIDEATYFAHTFYGQPPSIGIDTTLTGAEIKAALRFWYNNFVFPTEDRYNRELFNDYFSVFANALYAAKHNFGGKIFSDSLTQGGFTVQLLRPVTVYAPGGTKVENWLLSSVTAGWNAKVFNFNTTLSGNANAVLNTLNTVTMLVFGLGDSAASPKAFEMQITDNNGAPQGVKPLSFITYSRGIPMALFDRVVYVDNSQAWYMDINYAAAGASNPQPIGVQFVLSSYANQE